MHTSKLRLGLAVKSIKDGLCLRNSVCHQVHYNGIAHFLRNEMKIVEHLILIASDVHHVVTSHWVSVTSQLECLFHANTRMELNHMKEATYRLPAVRFDKTFCLLK